MPEQFITDGEVGLEQSLKTKSISADSGINIKKTESAESVPPSPESSAESTLSSSPVQPSPIQHQKDLDLIKLQSKIEEQRDVQKETKSSLDAIAHPKVQTPTYSDGPDKVIETAQLFTSKADEAVKLRWSEKAPLDEPALSVMTTFRQTVDKLPNHRALAWKENPKGEWIYWTYEEYYRDVRKAAKAFIKLGLQPCHGVGILGFNSPHWFISDLGTVFAGGLATGVYTTNNPEACHYVLDNCSANICVVENDVQLQKILKVRSRLPHLKAIIQYLGKPKENYPDVYCWEDFMALSSQVTDAELESRINAQAPNMCCTLIYTSGTTGNPKGVMLSHDNHVWTAKVCINEAKLKFGEEHVISYLPLSHVAAQELDIYAPIIMGGTVYFALPDALKGSLGHTMKEVRPTYFLGVPRVWEKIMEKMMQAGKDTKGLKKKLVTWAKDVGFRGSMAKMNAASMPFGHSLASKLVFKKVKQALGLDRCHFAISGAAPIMKETLDFFMCFDIPIFEIYGMSESSGPHTLSLPWKFRIGMAGPEMPGASTKFDCPDAEGNGEICMGGRHVFMGYLNMEEKTREAIDPAGWLHSGDVGRKDAEGFICITGRIKELIITAGGENIPPILIEDIVKEELPCVSNAMLIGDKRKFLSVLLTLKTEFDGEGRPLSKLSVPAIDWCRKVSSNATNLSDILEKQDDKVLKAIQEGIDRTNKRATSRAQCIQKWSILPRDFSIAGGELGPTLKLKRPAVVGMYEKTIEAFYSDSADQ